MNPSPTRRFAKDFGGPIVTVIVGLAALAVNILVRKDVRNIRDDLKHLAYENATMKSNSAAVEENQIWKLRETRFDQMAEIAKVKINAPEQWQV